MLVIVLRSASPNKTQSFSVSPLCVKPQTDLKKKLMCVLFIRSGQTKPREGKKTPPTRITKHMITYVTLQQLLSLLPCCILVYLTDSIVFPPKTIHAHDTHTQ